MSPCTVVKRGRSLVLLTVALTVAVAHPARAHHGYAGPVRLYLESVRLDTPEQGWTMQVVVNDAGTGRRAPGFIVEASGTGPSGAAFGPLQLVDPDGDARYEAALGALPTGDWSVTVNVTDRPDSDERAIPVTRTWNLTNLAGQSVELVGKQTTLDDRAGSSGSGGTSAALPVAGAAALAGAGVVLVVRRRRRPYASTAWRAGGEERLASSREAR